jgi:DNA-binding NarL/FixJ family response regulator
MVPTGRARHAGAMDAASRSWPRATAPTPRDDGPQGGAITIVVGDDVAVLRHILREVFAERPGLEVIAEAGTGRECVEAVSAGKPDVLLLDLSMPEMDGLEALPEIVASSPATRIVVFSGFAADRMGPAVLERGADLYIEKGTPPDVLADAILALAPPGRDGGSRPPP